MPLPTLSTPALSAGPETSVRFSIYKSAKLRANALNGLTSTSAKAIAPSSVTIIPSVIFSAAPAKIRGRLTAVLITLPNPAAATLIASLLALFSANLPSSFVAAVLAAALPVLNNGPVRRNSTINAGSSVIPSAILPPIEIPLACFSSSSMSQDSISFIS